MDFIKQISLSKEHIGKSLPNVVDMEQVVLGACMIDDTAIPQLHETLKSFMFYEERHQLILNAIYDVFESGNRVDLKTVATKLKEKEKLDEIGGAYYLASLTNMVNSSANVLYHARAISENYIKRALIFMASEISKESYDGVKDVFEILSKMEDELFTIGESFIKKNYSDMKKLLPAAIELIESRRNMKEGLTGIPSGFTAVDRITSGFQPSDLIIFAARPGMGKTAFVISALRNAAVEFDMPVAIFSLEMSSVQLTNRLISAEAELSSEKIKNGKMEPYEWELLLKRSETLSKAPIFIDDTPGLTILELRAKARRLVAQHGVKMIVIDYLQLMTGESKGSSGNREQEIAQISRSLKMIAKELNIPIIALSQLSRAVETRGGDKRPQLSDLRESGSIEQDADMVMFLYRPEYYGLTEDENGMSVTGMGEVIFAKNRHGKLESAYLRFIGQFTKFTDLETGNLNSGFGNDTVKTMNIPSKGNDGFTPF